MKEHLVSCKGVYFKVKNDKSQLKVSRKDANCFVSLPSNEYFSSRPSYITLYNYECKTTKEFTDFYINYIIDMLKLENVILKKNIITFKAFPERKKNLLVLTLLRILFEEMREFNNKMNIKNVLNVKFLNNLKNGTCEYTEKLERFCYFYKNLIENPENVQYWSEGHTPKPWLTVIKNYEDFKNTNFINIGVNDFFYGKK